MNPRRLRPKMQNYGISDAEAGMLDWAWADQRLTDSRNYWIVTASPDGQPGAAPVWAVWMDGALYFGVDAASRKGRHLIANPRVIVHLESGDEVVILEGRAETATDADALTRMQDLYEAKYVHRPDPSEPGSLYLRIVPAAALAWNEHDFPTSATRFEFD